MSEECRLWPSSHGLGLRDTGHVETDRPWTLAPTQTLSVTNSALIKCFHWFSTATYWGQRATASQLVLNKKSVCGVEKAPAESLGTVSGG